MSTTVPDCSHQDHPLAERINHATKVHHDVLNMMVLKKLPLALPPNATDPLLYAIGLLHIAPIYIMFESMWSRCLGIGDQISELSNKIFLSKAESAKEGPVLSTTLRTVLGQLRIANLMRSDRLLTDIQTITGWSRDVVEEQLAIVSGRGNETNHLQKFLQHSNRTIQARPHDLLAYSYIMYMALFAGGRYMRRKLDSAGKEFWGRMSSPNAPSSERRETEKLSDSSASALPQKLDSVPHEEDDMLLQFFRFDSAADGEELKASFKKAFAESDGKLTSQQKGDIISEAICIYMNLIKVVDQLDGVVKRLAGVLQYRQQCQVCDKSQPATFLANIIAEQLATMPFRDSIVVTRERRAHARSTKSASNDHGDEGEPLLATVRDANAIDGKSRQCPAASLKSVRFKTGPFQPGSNQHPKEVQSTQITPESVENDPRYPGQKQLTNWALGVALALLIVSAILSSRWMASKDEET